MRQCEGFYAASFSNASTYFWTALCFLGFPLSFYLYFKYPGELYWNVCAFVIITSAAFLFTRIIVARVKVFIEGALFRTESYFFSRWMPTHDITIEQIEKITHSSDKTSSTIQVTLSDGSTISIFNPDKSLIEAIRGSFPDKFRGKTLSEKQSINLALAVIGIVVADIVLIFMAIYLST